MLTLFVAMGFLKRDGGIFSLTGLAREHLVRTSPWFIGPYYASLKERPVCRDLLNVLRTDKPANWGSLNSEKEWARAMEDEEFASQFTAAMDCRGVYLGQGVAINETIEKHTVPMAKLDEDFATFARERAESANAASQSAIAWCSVACTRAASSTSTALVAIHCASGAGKRSGCTSRRSVRPIAFIARAAAPMLPGWLGRQRTMRMGGIDVLCRRPRD